MAPAIPTLPDDAPAPGTGLSASMTVGWRAVTRSPAYRFLGALMAILGLAGPLLVSTFFFFVEEHTRAEFLAANVTLWSVVFAFLLTPRLAVPIRSRALPTFNALVPVSPEVILLGRYAGVFAAYLAIVLVPLVPALVLESLARTGHPLLLLHLSLTQIALGAVLLSAVFCLSQAGSPLFVALTGIAWFVLGTQKAGWIAAPDGEWSRTLLAVLLAWLPDFALLSPGSFSDTTGEPGLLGIGLRIVYGLVFVLFHLLLAATGVRLQRKGSGHRPGKRARALRRLR